MIMIRKRSLAVHRSKKTKYISEAGVLMPNKDQLNKQELESISLLKDRNLDRTTIREK